METIPSFAPLAGRLAAHAAELRPVEGSRDNLAKFMALVMCALLDMLILVCEMLDTRDAICPNPVTASVQRADKAVSVPTLCAGRQTLSGARPVRLLSLSPAVQLTVSERAVGHSETAEMRRVGPWLAWSRDPAPLGAASPLRTLSTQNAVFRARPMHVHFVAIS